jgi:hypothetical protein
MGHAAKMFKFEPHFCFDFSGTAQRTERDQDGKK